MVQTIGSVSLAGLFHEDSQYTFLLDDAIVAADVGKAVTMSTTANTVQLAGDGDKILGRLETFEDRVAEDVKVGTVAVNGGIVFLRNPNATASSPDETPAVGDYITGGTATGPLKGYVNKSATATRWLVVELLSSTKLVAISQ